MGTAAASASTLTGDNNNDDDDDEYDDDVDDDICTYHPCRLFWLSYYVSVASPSIVEVKGIEKTRSSSSRVAHLSA